MDEKTKDVLYLLAEFGGIDGAHHKQWLLDQIARVLLEDNYSAWVAEYNQGQEGPNASSWDEGIAP
jgi:hypothetical protein